MTFGSRLKELRLKNNMTQRELSERLFVTRQAVTKWENDKSIPEEETLEKLSSIFNVSTYFLLHGEEEGVEAKKEFNPKRYIKTAIVLALSLIILLTLIIVPLNVYSTTSGEEESDYRNIGAYISFDEIVRIDNIDSLYNIDLPYIIFNREKRYFDDDSTLIIPEGEFKAMYVYHILYSWNENEYIINEPVEYSLEGGLKEYEFDDLYCFKARELVPLKSIRINYIDLKHENIVEELIYLDDDGKLTSSLGRLIDSYRLNLIESYLTASYTVEAIDINNKSYKYNINETSELLLYIKNPKKSFVNGTSYRVRFII